MGLVNQTITFTAGIKPTASQWTNQFTTLYNLVNGQLDSANVDKTSGDGVMVLDTAQTRTAKLTMSTAGIAMTGAISASAWGTTGVVYSQAAATYTDSSTAGSGTATNAAFASYAQPTLAATNASVTTTNAATVYIANAPTAGTNQTITNAYALWVDAGAVRFDGTLASGTITVSSDMTIATGAITSASGAISFNDENLTTTGTFSAGATTVTSLNASEGNITNVGDIALDTISSDAGTTITVSLGTDAGDDFIIGSNLFVFEGDKGQAVITPSAASNYGVDIVQSQSEATQGNLAHYDYGSAGAAVKGRTKTSISTTPTVIANPIGRGGMWLVTGNDSTNYFLDLVWYADNVTPAVIQSLTAAGSPATRTYSNTSNQMYLAMSTGTYTINAFGIGVEDPA